MSTQRYVSPELTHFVGRSLPEDRQYSLLVDKILKTGWLKTAPWQEEFEVLESQAMVGAGEPRVDTDAADAQVVCFCDIPVTDLNLHMNKYSRFGLSFLKPFLISKGASPVMYVANNSRALPFGLSAEFDTDTV